METLKGTLRKYWFVDCAIDVCDEEDTFWGLGWTKGSAGISLLERGWTHQREKWLCPNHGAQDEEDE